MTHRHNVPLANILRDAKHACLIIETTTLRLNVHSVNTFYAMRNMTRPVAIEGPWPIIIWHLQDSPTERTFCEHILRDTKYDTPSSDRGPLADLVEHTYGT